MHNRPIVRKDKFFNLFHCRDACYTSHLTNARINLTINNRAYIPTMQHILGWDELDECGRINFALGCKGNYPCSVMAYYAGLGHLHLGSEYLDAAIYDFKTSLELAEPEGYLDNDYTRQIISKLQGLEHLCKIDRYSDTEKENGQTSIPTKHL